MKHLFIILFVLFCGNLFAGDGIPVKHDSCVNLRFNKVLLYRKGKAGIYDVEARKFIQKYEKARVLSYSGNAEFDAVEWNGTKENKTFYFLDTAIRIDIHERILNRNSIMFPSYKNAYALVDTVERTIIMKFFDPENQKVEYVSSPEYLHMAITYPAKSYGKKSTVRTNNIYSKYDCVSYDFTGFVDCQTPIGLKEYEGEVRETPFLNNACEYFSITFSNNEIIVTDYGPYNFTYNGTQKNAWAHSRIYDFSAKKWIAPEGCVYISPTGDEKYIYKNHKQGKPYYILDAKGEFISRSNPNKMSPGYDLDPNFILGGPWDEIQYLPINDRRRNFKSYYQCRKGNKYAIVELQQNPNYAVQYPISPLADLVSVSHTHSLIISINNDTLYLNFQGNTDQSYPLNTDSSSYFFPYFSSVKESYDYIDTYKEAPNKFMLEEPYLHVVKKENYVIINLPFKVDKTLPKTVIGENRTIIETTYYDTEESAVFIHDGNRYSRKGGYVSRVTEYPFGFVLKTGAYISKTDSEEGRPKLNNEYPYGQFAPTYKMYSLSGDEITAYTQNEFAQVLDLGFGFQIYISGKSFFMNYEGEIITQPIFHEFYIENENLIGVVFEDVRSKNKKILLKKAFAQF